MKLLIMAAFVSFLGISSSAAQDFDPTDRAQFGKAGKYTHLYPQGPDKNPNGRVRLRCLVGESGHPSDCQIIEEVPLGLGFGAAALRMSSMMRLRTVDAEGKSTVGNAVKIPMRFTDSRFPDSPVTVPPEASAAPPR
jgi:hypothetical protein